MPEPERPASPTRDQLVSLVEYLMQAQGSEAEQTDLVNWKYPGLTDGWVVG